MALGPASKGVIWKDAVNKFRRRALDINRAKMPAVLSIKAYNTKAVSVLGYIAQFSPPPEGLVKLEMAGVNLTLRFATSSLSWPSINFIRDKLGINLSLISAMIQASAIRAARQTFCSIDLAFMAETGGI